MTDLPPIPPAGGVPGGPTLPGGVPPAPDRRRWLVPVAVLVLVALVAGGAGWVLLRDDGGEPAASTSTVPAPSTTAADESATTTTDEAPSAERAELEALVDELQRYVEEERGLPFLEDVEVELLDDDAFEARLLEDFEEDREELEQDTLVLQALGVLEPGRDLADALEEVLTAGVLGFYDPKTDELVVRGTDLNLYVQETIVHELVHALDDQHFDLDRPELEDVDDESGFGFDVLAEGSARYVDQAWADDLTPDEREQLAVEELRFGAEMDIDPQSFPFDLFELIRRQYPLGAEFVDALVATGGSAAVDEAYADPPTTSKEVMEPEAYVEGFEPVEVPPPPADGEVVDEGAFGQFLLEFVLDTQTSADAEEVASGWAGDWYVAWEAEGRTCVRIDIVGEDRAASEAIAEALDEWAEGLLDAEVARAERGAVRLTSCVDGTTSGGGADRA